MPEAKQSPSDERTWGAFEYCWYCICALLVSLLYHRFSGDTWSGEYAWAGATVLVYLVSLPVAFGADSTMNKLIRFLPSTVCLFWIYTQAGSEAGSNLLGVQLFLEAKHFFFVFLLCLIPILFTAESEESQSTSSTKTRPTNTPDAPKVKPRRPSGDPFDRIIGQPHVVAPLKEIAKMARSNIRVGKKDAPYAVLLFLGPTGVGKTEAARSLTEAVYGSTEAMVRFDMGQFTDAHQANRFYGPPPGYVGSDAGGQLTQSVAKKPRSLVLLDEVEKAHPQIWDAFLPVFDEGYVVDGSFNTKIDMRQTVIVLTSNLLSGEDGLAGRSPFEIKEAVEATKAFRPELLGRINEILVFNPLSPEVIAQILRQRMDAALWGLSEQGISLVVDESEIDALVVKVREAKFGVRQIDDVVRTHLRSAIAERGGKRPKQLD